VRDEAVHNTDFDAQSIIAAVTDDTPVKLAVAEQTLVGRITGGNIDDLSAAQVQTLLSVLARPTFADPGSNMTRTYKGYEILDTATTYEIGAGKDYETYAAAADALQGLILQADLTLKLMANTTASAEAVFKGLISVGGQLCINLNTYTYEVDSGAPISVMKFECPAYVFITNGTIKASTASTEPLYYVLAVNHPLCFLYLRNNVTLDADSKAYRALVSAESAGGTIFWYATIEANVANLNEIIGLNVAAFAHALVTDPTSWDVDGGAIFVKAAGAIVTSGGTITPV